MAEQQPTYLEPQLAWRLFLAFEGEEIQPTSYYEVFMLVPPSDSLEPFEGYSGSWFELNDADGTVLYRRIIYDLLGALPDLYQLDDPNIYTVRVQKEADPPGEAADFQGADLRELMPETAPLVGEFSLLLPVLEEAVWLSIYNSPPTLHEFALPARQIARFNLDESR